MQLRITPNPCLRFLWLGAVLVLSTCGGGQDPVTPGGSGTPPNADVIALALDGGPEITYTENSDLPSIDCDPRVDWGANQVILWEDFTRGSGPSGYEFFFEIMFPMTDGVGTYSVQGDALQAFLHYNGEDYAASPLAAASNGTAVVTRSDDRIEGTFTVTVVDSLQTTAIALSGRFGVSRGFSLSCP